MQACPFLELDVHAVAPGGYGVTTRIRAVAARRIAAIVSGFQQLHLILSLTLLFLSSRCGVIIIT